MDFQIRHAVTENVKGDGPEQFRETIQDAISRGDEHLLPGLGVLLEKWWQNTSEEEHSKFTEALAKAFQH
ncbi:small acid-soluble spore protein SspI [Ureibacillus sp. FSL K6-8385]|uniref:Small, acid-soluble spore protein I n=1 Tax=Ureibacillus terrenus TaxID=118246 RepID=A0A540V1J1_9BACL|nr:small acid-soluble spore protein SspI [Ureibacillus terrenus]MED3661976.1 small acid-soluble spore protein SspI [Ureibacillus terrenus]MED3764760.1 small acid-soluble spore protein SspI [Ureibacillus terrenus]TQE90605.1 small acid-soluble spore protein SspI [Ureibacillus terrenus]